MAVLVINAPLALYLRPEGGMSYADPCCLVISKKVSLAVIIAVRLDSGNGKLLCLLLGQGTCLLLLINTVQG